MEACTLAIQTIVFDDAETGKEKPVSGGEGITAGVETASLDFGVRRSRSDADLGWVPSASGTFRGQPRGYTSLSSSSLLDFGACAGGGVHDIKRTGPRGPQSS
jgi:hypothetical protein